MGGQEQPLCDVAAGILPPAGVWTFLSGQPSGLPEGSRRSPGVFSGRRPPGNGAEAVPHPNARRYSVAVAGCAPAGKTERLRISSRQARKQELRGLVQVTVEPLQFVRERGDHDRGHRPHHLVTQL